MSAEFKTASRCALSSGSLMAASFQVGHKKQNSRSSRSVDGVGNRVLGRLTGGDGRRLSATGRRHDPGAVPGDTSVSVGRPRGALILSRLAFIVQLPPSPPRAVETRSDTHTQNIKHPFSSKTSVCFSSGNCLLYDTVGSIRRGDAGAPHFTW